MAILQPWGELLNFPIFPYLCRNIPFVSWLLHDINHIHTGVSINGGTSKSSILIGCYLVNHPFGGIPIYGNHHLRHFGSGVQCDRSNEGDPRYGKWHLHRGQVGAEESLRRQKRDDESKFNTGWWFEPL